MAKTVEIEVRRRFVESSFIFEPGDRFLLTEERGARFLRRRRGRVFLVEEVEAPEPETAPETAPEPAPEKAPEPVRPTRRIPPRPGLATTEA